VYILEKSILCSCFLQSAPINTKTSNTWVFLHSFLHKHLLLGCKLGQQLLLTFPGQFSSELQNTNSDKNFRKECYSFLLWFHQFPEWYSDYTLNNTSSQNHKSRTYFSNKRLTKRFVFSFMYLDVIFHQVDKHIGREGLTTFKALDLVVNE